MLDSLYPKYYLFAAGDGDDEGGSDTGGGDSDSSTSRASDQYGARQVAQDFINIEDSVILTDTTDIINTAAVALSKVKETEGVGIALKRKGNIVVIWPSKASKTSYQKYFDAYLKGASENLTHTLKGEKGGYWDTLLANEKQSRPRNIVVIWPSKSGFTQYQDGFNKFLTDTISQTVDIADHVPSIDDGTILSRPKSSVKISWPPKITQVIIDPRNIPANGGIRTLTINGFEGAMFNIHLHQVVGNNIYSYDFNNTHFTTGSVKYSKQITLPTSGKTSETINFPVITSNCSYYFEISSLNDTTLSIGGNPKFYKSASIYQYVDTDITFSLVSAGSSGSYNTLPTNIVSSGLRGILRDDVSIDWDVSLSASSFVVIRQPTLSDFKTSRSDIYTTNGTGSSSTTLTLDSVDHLVTGIALTAVESGSVSGSPLITNIDYSTKVVTLSVAQSWADNKEITFTEYGLAGFGLYGVKISTKSMSVVADDVETTTTGVVSASTTVPVSSVSGIEIDTTQTVDGATTDSIEVILDSIANLWVGQTLVHISSGTLDGTPTITYINSTSKELTLSSAQTLADGITLKFANSIVSGIGINSSTTNPYVDAVSSLNLTLSAAQTLESGIGLTFTGCSRAATITIEMNIVQMGDSNFTTTLQLDNILTVI